MSARPIHSGSRAWPRRLGLWAIIGPFLLLSLLAPGVMPVRATDGRMVLVLCTPDGPQEISVDLETGGTDHQKDRRCDWAQAMPGAALLNAPMALPVLIASGRPVPLPLVAGIPPAHDPHGICARGPPAKV